MNIFEPLKNFFNSNVINNVQTGYNKPYVKYIFLQDGNFYVLNFIAMALYIRNYVLF